MPPAWCPLRSFPGLCRSPRSTGSPGVRYSPCRKRATTIAALTGSLEASRTADPAPPQPAKGWAEELLLTERGSGGGAPQSGADRCSLSPPSPCRGRVGNFWCPVTTYENTVLWLAPSGSMVSALLQVCGLAVDPSRSSLGLLPRWLALADRCRRFLGDDQPAALAVRSRGLPREDLDPRQVLPCGVLLSPCPVPLVVVAERQPPPVLSRQDRVGGGVGRPGPAALRSEAPPPASAPAARRQSAPRCRPGSAVPSAPPAGRVRGGRSRDRAPIRGGELHFDHDQILESGVLGGSAPELEGEPVPHDPTAQEERPWYHVVVGPVERVPGSGASRDGVPSRSGTGSRGAPAR